MKYGIMLLLFIFLLGCTEKSPSGEGESTTTQKTQYMAPDFSLPNREGKPVRLSDFRGKLVLVDFWASWCMPCRQENPNVVRIFNQYKDRGFTILSVSLDTDFTKWERAIVQDGLIWENHVSDLKGWESSIVPLYGIEGIPYTMLIDPNGAILGNGLRGEALATAIEEFYTRKK
ncbi:MAG: peroxiredoxin family protein [Flavobacteriales bacterium]